MPPSEPRIPEWLLAEVWKRQMVPKEGLITVDGKQVRVIYPGRRNNDSGPDFRDAIIIMSGGKAIRGDIELHVRSKEWWTHGHHHDPGYNGIILHVVMWDDGIMHIPLQDGRKVPVVSLARYLDGSLDEIYRRARLQANYPDPCQNAIERLGVTVLGQLLDSAGEDRFRSKVSFFRAELNGVEPGQVLYEGIMGALGYAKNKSPFRQLAQRLPLYFIWELAPEGCAQAECRAIQAMLLGMAGLLPSQRRRLAFEDNGGFGAELERLWYSMSISHEMSETDWRLFRVRPANFPTRRLAAAAYLLTRYRGRGLLEGVLRLVMEASLGAGYRKLEDGLVVITNDYWTNHFDFGMGGVRSSTLLGRGRAREIVVNIVLPFFFAWAEAHSRPRLAKEVIELYSIYPGLNSNWITRLMAGRLAGEGASRIVNSAQRQQGLLYVYHTYCVERRCHQCPMMGLT